MKITRAKQVKKSPLGKPKTVVAGKTQGKTLKAKPRSLGCGTHQKPEHAPHVV